MESISQYLNLPEIKKSGSERSELLQFFHERVRDKSGKPYRIAFLGMKLSHLKINDLYYLKSVCTQSNNFDRTFWGSIKVK